MRMSLSRSRLGEESTGRPDGEGEQVHAETRSSPSGTGRDGWRCVPSRLCGLTGTAAGFVWSGVRRSHDRDAVLIRVWPGTQGCPRASDTVAGLWDITPLALVRPVSTSALSAALCEKTPVPFASRQESTERSEVEQVHAETQSSPSGKGTDGCWCLPSRLCGSTGTAAGFVGAGVRRGQNRDAVGGRVLVSREDPTLYGKGVLQQ